MSRLAVLLAGGRGARLAPYTAVFPKPLVPIGDMPVADILVRQLAAAGFDEICFCAGHLAELLEAYFMSHPLRGSGVRFRWVREGEPLGTAGPLRLVEDLPERFLVLNGDLLTTLDFGAFFDRHVESGADLTIAVQRHQHRTQLGVVRHEGDRVTGYEEKPSFSFDVSMGVYAYSRACIETIPAGLKFDFPDLVGALLERGRDVRIVLSGDTWLDIGNPEDYSEAQRLFQEDPGRFLGRCR